ncbi:MAG: riboflavin synthase [Ignavibacteria bacterium]|nr:riboflavin synthase [Ignavibacteria bacterium]
MFTGIIETLGVIKNINRNEISVQILLDDLKIGDSVSVNGICLTISEIKKSDSFALCNFNISPETYSRTNLKFLKVNDSVNIERALKLNSRLDGHIVTGHVDDVSKILSIRKTGDSFEFVYSIPDALNKFIAEKGSVAIDGISLTVAKKMGNKFSVAIVPYTFQNTNLKFRKVGDYVNLEVDILARYVETLFSKENNENKLKYLIGEKW